jgi:hypothetical protein
MFLLAKMSSDAEFHLVRVPEFASWVIAGRTQSTATSCFTDGGADL